MKSCTSTIVCTTSHESYASVFTFQSSSQDWPGQPMLAPALSGSSLPFSLPALPCAGVSNKAGYPPPLNGIIWGEKCVLNLEIADAAFSLPLRLLLGLPLFCGNSPSYWRRLEQVSQGKHESWCKGRKAGAGFFCARTVFPVC